VNTRADRQTDRNIREVKRRIAQVKKTGADHQNVFRLQRQLWRLMDNRETQ
jgi:hypothetical protein